MTNESTVNKWLNLPFFMIKDCALEAFEAMARRFKHAMPKFPLTGT